MKNSSLTFLILLVCSSANAAMYSCVDEIGAKTLRNYPCEGKERGDEIDMAEKPSYSEITSTGERQYYQSRKIIYTWVPRPAETERSAKSEFCAKMERDIANAPDLSVMAQGSWGDMANAKNINAMQNDLVQRYNITCVLPLEERSAAIANMQNENAQRKILQKLNNIERVQNNIERVQQFGY